VNAGFTLTPPGAALAWRLLGEVLLCVMWIRGSASPLGLAMILLLAGMSLLRWRFAFPAWTVLIDQALCLGAVLFWPQAVFGLALPAFDAATALRPWFALPLIAALFALRLWSLPLAAALCVAAAAGAAIALWRREVQRLRREADADRREKFELSRLRDDLRLASVQAGRTAELAERARIARDIHDHLGHELTAAGLALEAFEQLWKEGDAQAAELLTEARGRIAHGMGVLRTTVSGLAPRQETGVGALEAICRGLSDIPTDFVVSGNTELVPAHAWAVLEPCLKEALTNAARHGAEGEVSVVLDVGPRIVRLSVHNAVRAEPSEGRGLGLRSLHQRAQAVGGSVTTDTTNGFRLVCVLPLEPGPAPAGASASTDRPDPAEESPR
jgi:signal transduction histidine kinase